MTWVLDASAIVCWLRAEPGANRLREIVADDRPCIQHATNTTEVCYVLWRRDRSTIEAIRAQLDAVGINVVRDLDDALLAEVVTLKITQSPISLADAFAVALAAPARRHPGHDGPGRAGEDRPGRDM